VICHFGLWSDPWVGQGEILKEKFATLFQITMQKDASVEEVCGTSSERGEGKWNWRRKSIYWKELVNECIRSDQPRELQGVLNRQMGLTAGEGGLQRGRRRIKRAGSLVILGK